MKIHKNNIIFLGLTIFCAISLFSCKEVPCGPAIPQLNFISFPDSETDTIFIRRFIKSSNFSTLLDTFFIDKHNSRYLISNDTLDIGSSFNGDNGLLSKYDYEIFIPQTSQLFKISEINEENSSHRVGLSMDKTSCTNTIKSYKLNGQLISGDYNYYRFFITR